MATTAVESVPLAAAAVTVVVQNPKGMYSLPCGWLPQSGGLLANLPRTKGGAGGIVTVGGVGGGF